MICAITACASEAKQTPPREQKIEPVEAEKAYDLFIENRGNPSFIIIDVRTRKEYELEHIPGAINFDYDSPSFGKSIEALDRNKIYLLYCKSSRTSEEAVQLFKYKGFREAYHIFGGLSEWIRKGYPVVNQ